MPLSEPPSSLHPGAREVRVASVDRGGIQRLQLALHGIARVSVAMHVSDLWTLRAGDVAILDACTPSIRLEEAARALEGSSATVVVWGAESGHRDRLQGRHGKRWLFIPQDTSPRELAEIVGAML